MSQCDTASPVAPLTALIDSIDFARKGRRMGGELVVADLPRLAEAMGGSVGVLHCSIVGEQDQEGTPYLVVEIEGHLQLLCQRCLQTMKWPLRSVSRLQLVAAGSEWPDEDLCDDEHDPIAADEAQHLQSLIEDEVILALPIAPRHEVCEMPATVGDEGNQSPFAVLTKLKNV